MIVINDMGYIQKNVLYSEAAVDTMLFCEKVKFLPEDYTIHLDMYNCVTVVRKENDEIIFQDILEDSVLDCFLETICW
jgi:hypothetical protein